MTEAKFTNDWSLVGRRPSDGCRLFGCLNPKGERCFWIDGRGEGPRKGRVVPAREAWPGRVPEGFVLYPEAQCADDRIACSCHPETDSRCPEHGRRCANPDCDELCAGPSEWTHITASGKRYYYCDQGCLGTHQREPVIRGIDPAADVKEACERFNIANRSDPYAEHRAKLEGMTDGQIQSVMGIRSEAQAARLRNVAALRAELDVGTEARWRRMTGPCHPVTGRPLLK